MKERTSIAIEARVRRAAKKAARDRGVSLSRYITEAIEERLAKQGLPRRFPRSVIFRGGDPYLSRDHDAAFDE